jgi:hypothetical protein
MDWTRTHHLQGVTECGHACVTTKREFTPAAPSGDQTGEAR